MLKTVLVYYALLRLKPNQNVKYLDLGLVLFRVLK